MRSSPGALAVGLVGGMCCLAGPPLRAGQVVREFQAVDYMAAEREAAILKALSGTSLPSVECDAMINFHGPVEPVTRVPAGEKRLLLFWSPTCGPCKPILADMAALASKKPTGLSLVGIVQSADPELEPPGEWRVVRVKRLVDQYKVSFPTCVHSSTALLKRWHAEAMPLTLLLSQKGVERVAAGGTSGRRLVAELAKGP